MSTISLRELIRLVADSPTLTDLKEALTLRNVSMDDLELYKEDLRALGYSYEAIRLDNIKHLNTHPRVANKEDDYPLEREIATVTYALTTLEEASSGLDLASQQELMEFYGLTDLNFIKILNIELAEIAYSNVYHMSSRSSPNSRTPGVHPIITLEYNDIILSIGVNLQTKSASYKLNNGPLRFYNFAISRRESIPSRITTAMNIETMRLIAMLLRIN